MSGCEFEVPGEFNKKLQGAGGKGRAVHGESDGSIGSVIAFLIEHGHSWTEIQNYTLSQMGLFVREATQLNELRRKEQITAAWLGFNVDKKGLNTILDSNPTKGPTSKAEEHKQNWNKLAARLRQMG